MTGMNIPEGVKSSEICAVIIRADGTREELGVISYYHRNPLRRWWFSVKKAVRNLKTWLIGQVNKSGAIGK